MKSFVFFISLALMACTEHMPDASSHLKEAMAYGSVTELNSVNPEMEKDLLVRLYQVPVFGEECFIETHGICRYKYYVSVSTFDEQPEFNVLALSTRGEVTGVEWKNEDKIDYVEIVLTFNSYTKAALDNNNALKNISHKVLLQINPKQLVELQYPDNSR